MHARMCVLGLALLFAAAPVSAVAASGSAALRNGLLFLEIRNAPLHVVLADISDLTGLSVYLAPELAEDTVSVSVPGVPLDQALRRILAGYSHVRIFTGSASAARVTGLKVFPKGKWSGSVTPLRRESPVGAPADGVKLLGRDPFAVSVQGNLNPQGVLGPAWTSVDTQPEGTEVSASWLAMQKQSELQEQSRFADLMLRQKRAESAEDPVRREALLASLAQDQAAFMDMKRISTNKVEAMKRLQVLHNMLSGE